MGGSGIRMRAGRLGCVFYARIYSKGLLRAMEKYEKEGRLKIVYGKRAEHIEEDQDGVCITFEDGEVAKGDLVIGADGIHSFTRRQLYAETNDVVPRAVYSGVTTIYGVVPLLKSLDPFSSLSRTTKAYAPSHPTKVSSPFHTQQPPTHTFTGFHLVPHANLPRPRNQNQTPNPYANPCFRCTENTPRLYPT
ncbi:FAD-binding domain protein [Rhizoctonia solani AG-3 Rhs1AP]|uniref:FAD-binding domain protein n=1 Tax=Rhizoctonia solani AG-3 Rhs1AP TaxID=1086054 RepID=X8J6D3_9AGAM|nr:FAD-binding domain protein [Rhizoctonia solani AG-3 Rhs1AP]